MRSGGGGLAGAVERVLDALAGMIGAIALALVFFAIVTPAAVIMRAFGKDPLRLARESAAASYWRARGALERSDDLEKQR